MRYLQFLLLISLCFGTASVWAQQVHQVNVSGENYDPQELSVFPGDSIRFCNEGIYRRQPYSMERYNRFSDRKADTLQMIKKGECKTLRVQNPTGDWLNVKIKDAVNPKGGIELKVSPKN